MIARRQSLRHVVRHDQRREVKLALISGDHGENRISAQGIETRRRLVEKHQFRPCHDGACQCQPLLHSAGKLTGVAVLMLFELELLQGLEAALANLPVLQARRLLQRQRHVFQGGQGIKQCIALEQKAAAPAKVGTGRLVFRALLASVEVDGSLVGLHNAAEAFQKDGLSRAAAAQHGHQAAALHTKAGAVEHDVVAKALPQALHLQQWSVVVVAHVRTRKEVIT